MANFGNFIKNINLLKNNNFDLNNINLDLNNSLTSLKKVIIN